MYPTCCKFAVTQNVEHSFVTVLRLLLLTYMQSICDQHPTGKQKLNCVVLHLRLFYTEVVLIGIPPSRTALTHRVTV